MYTEQEIRDIQELTKYRALSNEQIASIQTEFVNKEIPHYIDPFIRLFATNPDLYRKVSEDERVKQYSIYGFFPQTVDLVYGSETSPKLYVEAGSRGDVVTFEHPTKKVVIKPLQNSREHEVAKIADEWGVGPKQYTTLDGFLTEQFIEGDLFSKLEGEKLSDDNMYLIGRRVGDILKRLHFKEIFYNDTILSDDFGRSHLIVPKMPFDALLFDYGMALRLERHPNLTDEEVLNYARVGTLELTALQQGLQQGRLHKETFDSIVNQYKSEITQMTKEQIMGRDLDFINEGLQSAKIRLGHRIIEPFLKGFKETYSH